MGRGAIIAWLVVPQAICALLAFGIVRAAINSARYLPDTSPMLTRVLVVMGNMVVLPQVILLFALLDIFLFNAFGVRLIPTWVFAVIIMALGLVVLVVFFLRTGRKFRRRYSQSIQE